MSMSAAFKAKSGALLEKIKERGGHLKEVPLDNAICLDGQDYKLAGCSDDARHILSLNDDPETYFDRRYEAVGHYMNGNGVTYFANEEGKLFAGYIDGDVMDKAGYKCLGGYGNVEHGGWPLEAIFDVGAVLCDSNIHEKWDMIRRQRILDQRRIDIKKFEAKCAEKFAERDVTMTTAEILEQGDFIKADGLAYIDYTGDIKKIVATNRYHDAAIDHRVQNAGTYSGEGGVIGFTDEKGKTYVGPYSRENQSLLDKVGYAHEDGVKQDIGSLGNGAKIIGYAEKGAVWATEVDMSVVGRVASVFGIDNAEDYLASVDFGVKAMQKQRTKNKLDGARREMGYIQERIKKMENDQPKPKEKVSPV